MSQLVGRVPDFIFVPPHPVFFGTSLVLAPTSRSAETVYFRRFIFVILLPPFFFVPGIDPSCPRCARCACPHERGSVPPRLQPPSYPSSPRLQPHPPPHPNPRSGSPPHDDAVALSVLLHKTSPSPPLLRDSAMATTDALLSIVAANPQPPSISS